MADERNTSGGGSKQETPYADLSPGKRILSIGRSLFYVARILWVLLSIGVLVFTLVHSDGKYKTDATVAETIAMLVLCFPSGWLVVLLVVSVVAGWNRFFGSEIPELLFVIFSWVLWTAAGYAQWFVFVPWCGRRLGNSARRWSRK
jgi:hypothetical protein